MGDCRYLGCSENGGPSKERKPIKMVEMEEGVTRGGRIIMNQRSQYILEHQLHFTATEARLVTLRLLLYPTQSQGVGGFRRRSTKEDVFKPARYRYRSRLAQEVTDTAASARQSGTAGETEKTISQMLEYGAGKIEKPDFERSIEK